jgi:hypothetical protein
MQNFLPNNYIFKIYFTKKINYKTNGLYYDIYNNHKFFCTKFEPNYCREFIPCFDEPNLKATFLLNIFTNSQKKILSNMPIKNTKKINNGIFTQFYLTPIMPTYTLTLIIGDYINILEQPLISNSGVKVNGYCFIEDIHKIELYLKHVINAINYYEKYFNYNYILPKLDIICIYDIDYGAMESWGLMVFNKNILFHNNDINKEIKNIIVIYHEIIHQWLGNLVTLKTWNDIWLNESLTEYICWNTYIKKYSNTYIDILFNEHHYKKILNIDNLYNINSIIPKKNNYNNLFGSVTYSKGACVFKYINGLIGKNKFQNILIELINKHKFSNIDFNDFYNTIIKFNTDIDYGELLYNNLHISGYPLVNIKIIKNNLFIKIKRFLYNNLSEKYDNDYNIPIYIKIVKITNNKKEIIIKKIIPNKENIIELEKYDYFYLNYNNELLCVINYENYDLNMEYMNVDEIIKYIYDKYILFINNYIEFDNFYNFIKKIILTNITNYFTYVIIINQINLVLIKLFEIAILIHKNNIINKFYFIKKILIKILTKIINKNYDKNIINNIFLLLSIYFNDKQTIKLLKEIFDSNKNNFEYSIYPTICINYPEKTNIIFDLIINKHIFTCLEFINKKYFLLFITKYLSKINIYELKIVLTMFSKNIQINYFIINFLKNNYEFIRKDILYHVIYEISLSLYNPVLNNILFELVNKILFKNYTDENYNIIIDILKNNILIHDRLQKID